MNAASRLQFSSASIVRFSPARAYTRVHTNTHVRVTVNMHKHTRTQGTPHITDPSGLAVRKWDRPMHGRRAFGELGVVTHAIGDFWHVRLQLPAKLVELRVLLPHVRPNA